MRLAQNPSGWKQTLRYRRTARRVQTPKPIYLAKPRRSLPRKPIRFSHDVE